MTLKTLYQDAVTLETLSQDGDDTENRDVRQKAAWSAWHKHPQRDGLRILIRNILFLSLRISKAELADGY